MFTNSFSLGGLDYKIVADFHIKNIENECFSNFQNVHVKNNITFQFTGIDSVSLRLPPLTSNEKSLISCFLFPKYIGRGVLIIPPFIKCAEDMSNLIIKTKSEYDVPLFRSELVKSKIFSFIGKEKSVILLIHLFSITVFDFSESKVEIFYIRDRESMFNSDDLENGIRRLFTIFLPKYSRVMLHSSGIIRNNKAILFFAHDEGGKTTVLKNATNGIFLSDDRNILHWDKNKIIAHNTPWGSMNTTPTKAEVGGMFLLKKSNEFNLQKLKATDMLQFIWDEHIHNWNFLPNFSRITAFNILLDICRNVPVYEMSFTKDYVDWTAIDQAISNIK